MSTWKARRFWTAASVVEEAEGFSVALDDRPVRTPLKAPLALPTREMAEAVAAEWDGQADVIDPLSMPVTRSANAAIDKVTHQRAEVAEMLAAYAETDLLCHRAEGPEALIDRQKSAWDPVLAWAADRHGAALLMTTGILPALQPEASLAAVRGVVGGFGPFSLTALHDLVTLSGSVVLGIYVADDIARADEGWRLSRIDEDWQISLWGEDDEATAAADRKHAAFRHAARFLSLANGA